jgi:phosphoserine phosphatase
MVIGDGANDLLMMREAGSADCFLHAKLIVRAQASYALNHVGLDGVLGLFTSTEAKSRGNTLSNFSVSI